MNVNNDPSVSFLNSWDKLYVLIFVKPFLKNTKLFLFRKDLTQPHVEPPLPTGKDPF